VISFIICQPDIPVFRPGPKTIIVEITIADIAVAIHIGVDLINICYLGTVVINIQNTVVIYIIRITDISLVRIVNKRTVVVFIRPSVPIRIARIAIRKNDSPVNGQNIVI